MEEVKQKRAPRKPVEPPVSKEDFDKLLDLVKKIAHYNGSDNIVIKAGYEPFRPKR